MIQGKLSLKDLFDFLGAVLCATAFLARIANPYVIELVHGCFNKGGLVGKDAALKVATIGRLHAYSSAGEVCRADIGGLAVEYPYLEMDSWAKDAFKTSFQDGIFIEVFLEGWSWLFRMNQPDLNTSFHKFSYLPEDGNGILTSLDIKVFDVGCTNPKGATNIIHEAYYLMVMLFVGYEFGERH